MIEPTVPQEGQGIYSDRIRLDRGPSAVPHYFSGTSYRPAKPGEAATHYPDVRNELGATGFVIRSRQ